VNGSITIRLPELGIAEKQESAVEAHISETSLSDEILMAEVCLGRREALAILFRRYSRLVRGAALRVLKDASEADDLLQDVFLLIHRFCRTFDGSKASAQFWILQMTYRRALSRRRYLNSRHFYTQVELDDQSIQVPEPRSEHFDGPIHQMLAELDLQKMFGILSEDQQKTLRLHFIEGYTLDEMAKMLGQTKGNVRHHSFRGLERLRKQIFGGKLPSARASSAWVLTSSSGLPSPSTGDNYQEKPTSSRQTPTENFVRGGRDDPPCIAMPVILTTRVVRSLQLIPTAPSTKERAL
jgi:RNA polymerase sigma-70 factor (ECF subfamily)